MAGRHFRCRKRLYCTVAFGPWKTKSVPFFLFFMFLSPQGFWRFFHQNDAAYRNSQFRYAYPSSSKVIKKLCTIFVRRFFGPDRNCASEFAVPIRTPDQLQSGQKRCARFLFDDFSTTSKMRVGIHNSDTHTQFQSGQTKLCTFFV